MTRPNPVAVLSLLALLPLSGGVACSSSSQPAAPGGPAGHAEARSALARDAAPALSAAEKQAVAEGSDGFTTALLAQLPADGNLAYSPFSVGVALSMLYAGAKGNTATEIAQALRWSVPQPRVAKSYDWLTLELATRAGGALAAAQAKAQSGGPGSTAPDPAAFRLHVVNSLWADQRLRFESPFLDTMAVDYGAGVTLADFVGAPDKERLAINQWVSDETQTRIRDLLPAESIDSDTVLVLVNALHLKLPWAQPLTAASKPAAFTLAGGGKVDATYVTNPSENAGWYEDADVQAVRVPLEGGKVSMIFALPKAGDLHAFEAGLTAAKLGAIRAGTQWKTVDLALPKFRFTTPSFSLVPALKALGMKAAFDQTAADLTGLGSTGNPLFVSGVFHEAMVGLDEKGVEAAAATAVVVSDKLSLPLADATFHADRPFFFAIVDEPTGTTLFAGRVSDPTK
jgi:serpin B